MREIKQKIYTFNELSEDAKEKARLDWLEDAYFHYGDNLIESLKKFENEFPIQINYWEYDEWSCRVSYEILLDDYDDYEFDEDENKEDIIELYKGEELKKYLMEYYEKFTEDTSEECCPLTGCCSDYAVLDPIYEFIKNPTDIDFRELLESCIENFEEVVVKEYECFNSEEFFKEACYGCGFEFYEDGTMYKK